MDVWKCVHTQESPKSDVSKEKYPNSVHVIFTATDGTPLWPHDKPRLFCTASVTYSDTLVLSKQRHSKHKTISTQTQLEPTHSKLFLVGRLFRDDQISTCGWQNGFSTYLKTFMQFILHTVTTNDIKKSKHEQVRSRCTFSEHPYGIFTTERKRLNLTDFSPNRPTPVCETVQKDKQ